MELEKPKTNGSAETHEPVKTHKDAVVRTGDPRDFSEVCRLLLLAHAEAGLFPASNMKVAYHVDRFLRGPWKLPDGTSMLPTVDRFGNIDTGTRGIIGVIGEAGGPPRTIEGLVMLGLGSYWYTDVMHIDEYIMFIDPGYRNSRHAHALIEWQKQQSEINKMPLITGILSNDRTEAKCRLLRRFIPKIGEFFGWLPEGINFESDTLTGPGRLIQGVPDGRRRR